MKELRAVRILLRILVEPGWAPFSVIALHLALAEFGLSHRFDHLLHFLGGASIGYFLFRTINLLSLLPSGNRWAAYAGAFTSSCTIAVFWEFAEFAADLFLHTTLQQSLPDTMLDLAFGVLGGTSALIVIAAIRLMTRAKNSYASAPG